MVGRPAQRAERGRQALLESQERLGGPGEVERDRRGGEGWEGL